MIKAASDAISHWLRETFDYTAEPRDVGRLELPASLTHEWVTGIRADCLRETGRCQRAAIFECGAVREMDSSGVALMAELIRHALRIGREITFENLRPQFRDFFMFHGFDALAQKHIPEAIDEVVIVFEEESAAIHPLSNRPAPRKAA